uniref:Kinesin-like protein n=1 Tax=Propithecus coquereli TaxID=379532 RepID=A0A2K6FRK7_PROCO
FLPPFVLSFPSFFPSIYNLVYGPAESQRAVFGEVCPLLTSLLDGYNVCIVAYGQTGSGKSYTMLGPRLKGEESQRDVGIVPRAVEELFRLISENPLTGPTVEVSVVEVYNNDIFDLLAKDSLAVESGARREATAARDGRKEAAAPTCEAVSSASELLRLVRGGLRRRATHPTLVHEDSSRSHLIVTVTVTTALGSDSSGKSPAAVNPPTVAGRRRSVSGPAWHPRLPDHAGRTEKVSAKLQLVDLAGSECAGGDAKFLVILCISPSQKHVAQTIQGLGFGTRARQVQRGQARRRPGSRTGE